MGVSPNWQGMPLEKMYGDINGGDGYQSTAASAAMWSGVATQLEDVADRVRTLTQGATAEWQGSGADAMTNSHNQFDTWAQDARDLSTRANQAADTQSSLFTDTRPKIEAPGDASQHQDNILEKGASYIPGVTTDQEAFEQKEAAKQKAAAAAMSSYESSVGSDAGRGYFSAPPVLAVTVGAAPVSPTPVPVPTPYDQGTPWTTPQARVRSADTQGVPTGQQQTGSPASSPASVSAASWQAPAVASGSATGPTGVVHPTAQPTQGPSGGGSASMSPGGALAAPGGRPTAGVSSQGWSDPARTGASSSTGAGSGVTGGAGSYGGPFGAGAPGSNRSRGGSSAGGATEGTSSVAPVVGGGFAAGSGVVGGGGASGSTGSGTGSTTGVGGSTGAAGNGPAAAAAGTPVGGTSGPGAAGRGGAAGAGGRGAQGEEDTEHEMPDFLKTFELFDDGRLVAPPVIGVLAEDE